jgi:cell wall-associated NlpC family hydrolase
VKTVDSFISTIIDVPYVLGGRDYNGMDCWGLVVLAYAYFYNIDIPEYRETAFQYNRGGLTAKDIQDHINTTAPFFEVETPEFGDFVLINIYGNPVHIGFMVDESNMLHISEKSGLSCVNIRGKKWINRIQGFYRYNKTG